MQVSGILAAITSNVLHEESPIYTPTAGQLLRIESDELIELEHVKVAPELHPAGIVTGTGIPIPKQVELVR